jgi:hypothetical protein
LLKMALNTITLTNFPSLKGPCNNFPWWNSSWDIFHPNKYDSYNYLTSM